MRRRKAFTLLEVLIVLAVVGLLFGLIYAFYQSAIEKSKHVEAVATVDAIGKAEEINQMNTGEYVAAANTQEINEKLGLNIEPRWYTYKVIDVTDDNFVVLAEKILDDINKGSLSAEPTVIARDRSGPISPQNVVPSSTEPTPAEETPSHPTSPPSSPTSGGPGGGGGSPGGGPGSVPPISPGDNPTGGGGESGSILYPSQLTVPSSIAELLNGTVSGDWAYDLINDNDIAVVYVNIADYSTSSNILGFWSGIDDQIWVVNGKRVFVLGNTIFINNLLPVNGYTDTAIASIITHESTHADYSYNPQAWIDATKAAHPELTDSDIHISLSPFNSIDQEYQAFDNSVDIWNEIKGADTNVEMDYWAAEKAAGGEALMKDDIRALYADQSLPEY